MTTRSTSRDASIRANAPVPAATTGTIGGAVGRHARPVGGLGDGVRSAESSSATSSSDSRPGSRTGPAATPGTKSACDTSTRRPRAGRWPSARRPATERRHDRRRSLVDADDDAADREPQLAAHHDDRRLGVVDHVVRGRAEQQRGLARAAVADDDRDGVAAGLTSSATSTRPRPACPVTSRPTRRASALSRDLLVEELVGPCLDVHGVDRRHGLVAGRDRHLPGCGRR